MKNGDVYGISPVMKTGSSGLSLPGFTGIDGKDVGVNVGVGAIVSPGIWLHPNVSRSTRVIKRLDLRIYIYFLKSDFVGLE
jgi:hypothetical protein